MSDQQVQENFSELLDSVKSSNDRVIVERMGKPSVVLLSADEYEELARLQRERNWAVIQQLRDDNADVDPDELMRDVTDAVEAVREELFGANARADSGNN